MYTYGHSRISAINIFRALKDKYIPSLMPEEELEKLKLGQAALLCKGLVSEIIKKATTPEEKKTLINTILQLRGEQKKYFEELYSKIQVGAQGHLYCLEASYNGLRICIEKEIITAADVFSAEMGINQPLLMALNSEKIRESLKEKKLLFDELYKTSQEWYVKEGYISIEKAQALNQKQLEHLAKDGIKPAFTLIKEIISFADFVEILKEPVPEYTLHALNLRSTRRYLNGVMQSTRDKQEETAADLRTLLSLEPDFFAQAEAKQADFANLLSPEFMKLYEKTPWFFQGLRNKSASELRKLLFSESEFFKQVSPKFAELLLNDPEKLKDKLLPTLKEFFFSDEGFFQRLGFSPDEKSAEDLEARLYQGYLAASDIPEAANLSIERLRGLNEHQRQNLNFIDIANKNPKLKGYFLKNPGSIEEILKFPSLDLVLYPSLTLLCNEEDHHQGVCHAANEAVEILEKGLLTLPQVLEIFNLKKSSPLIVVEIFDNVLSPQPLNYYQIQSLLKKDDNDIEPILKIIKEYPKLTAGIDEKLFEELMNKPPRIEESEWGPLIILDVKNVKQSFIDIFSNHGLPLITSYDNPQEIKSLVLEDERDLMNPHYNARISDDKNYRVIPGAARRNMYGKIGNLLFSFCGSGKGSMDLICSLIEKAAGRTILSSPYILELGRHCGVGPEDFFPRGFISRPSAGDPTDVSYINTLSGRVNFHRAHNLRLVFNDTLYSRVKTVEDFHRRIIETENSKPPIKKLTEYLSSITTQQTEDLIAQNPAIMILLEKGLATCSLKEAENMETVLLKTLEGSPKFLITIATILEQESTEYTYRILLEARRIKGREITEIFELSKVAISLLPLNEQQGKLFQELINKEMHWDEAEKALEIAPAKERAQALSSSMTEAQILKAQEELSIKELCVIEELENRKLTAERLKKSLSKIWDASMCREMNDLIQNNPAFMKLLEQDLDAYASGEKDIKAAFLKILEGSPNFLITAVAMLPSLEVQNIYIILRAARIIKGSEINISNTAIDLLPLEELQKDVLKERINKQLEPREERDFLTGAHSITKLAWGETEKALEDARHIDLSSKLETITIEEGSPAKKSKVENELA